MIEERLIGFDVREMWMDSESLWDDARRSTFLFVYGLYLIVD